MVQKRGDGEAFATAAASQDKTKLFPKDWITSYESLFALRSVQQNIKERSFHEATHVLYDIRTWLGNRPAKYLEVGTFTGISSSLMLKHPLPTSVTAVDPCILPKHFIHGDLNQEETIRKNLAFHTAPGCKINEVTVETQRGIFSRSAPYEPIF